MSNSKDNGAGVGGVNAAVDGDVLRPYQEAVEEAQKEVRRRTKKRDEAEVELEEYKKEMKDKGKSPSDIKKNADVLVLEKDLATAKAKLSDAKAELADAKAELAEEELKTADEKDKEDIRARILRHTEEAKGHRQAAHDIRTSRNTGGGSAATAQNDDQSNAFSSVKTGEEKLFTIDWVEKDDVTEAFKGRLLDMFNNRMGYLGPLLPVCQSSGWGKSRLFQHFSEDENFCVVYVSFMKHGASGFPARTASADLFYKTIKKAGDNEKAIESALQAFLVRICKAALSRGKGTTVGRQTDDDDKFWEKVEQSEGCANAAGAAAADGDTRVVLVLDEAGELLEKKDVDRGNKKFETNMFRLIRGAMNNIKEDISMVIVAASTTSRVTNFAPAFLADGSARKDAGDTVQPFYDLPRDVLVKDKDNSTSMTSFSLNGRPLWASGVKVGHYDENAIPEYAAKKLRCGISLSLSDENVERDLLRRSRVAAVACRVPISLSPTIATVDDFMSSHMGTLVDLSESRETGTILYPPESALASGGAMIMDAGFKDVLHELHHGIATGLVAKGEMGELTAMLILLRTYDKALVTKRVGEKGNSTGGRSTRSPYFVPAAVSLEEYFKTMLGGVNVGAAFAHCPTATVKFNAFMRFHKTATVSDLKYCYERNMAILCKKCEVAVDMLIPFKFKKSDSDSDSYGVVSVQVKNYKGWKPLGVAAGKKLGVLNAGVSNVGLYIDVGMKLDNQNECQSKVQLYPSVPEREGRSTTQKQRPQQNIVVQGISQMSFPLLSDDECKILNVLADDALPNTDCMRRKFLLNEVANEEDEVLRYDVEPVDSNSK